MKIAIPFNALKIAFIYSSLLAFLAGSSDNLMIEEKLSIWEVTCFYKFITEYLKSTPKSLKESGVIIASYSDDIFHTSLFESKNRN